mmetsp:Transcript_25040/g.52974  ORF Transcript_25040/g.52974 Transcript_25040/m.52974 type:complete len:179 (+) Transcript_25040:153-689(+)
MKKRLELSVSRAPQRRGADATRDGSSANRMPSPWPFSLFSTNTKKQKKGFNEDESQQIYRKWLDESGFIHNLEDDLESSLESLSTRCASQFSRGDLECISVFDKSQGSDDDTHIASHASDDSSHSETKVSDYSSVNPNETETQITSKNPNVNKEEWEEMISFKSTCNDICLFCYQWTT